MKPDFYGIIHTDSSRATADLAVDAVANVPDYFEEVLNISLNEKSPLNWRAARVVFFASMKYPELFRPHANSIAILFPSFEVDGLKRTYAYLLSKYIDELNEDGQSIMIESCFDYMMKDEKTAVKYSCMKFLFEMCKVIPELKGELAAVIEMNITEGTLRLNGEIKRIYKEIESGIN